MVVYKNRVAAMGGIIYDNVDFFGVDLYTKAVGLTPASFQVRVLYNGSALGWPLVDGSSVTDPQVVAGNIYFTEPTPGNYLLRFYPNAPGNWTVELRYDTVPQQVSVSVDTFTSLKPNPSPGLFPSFTP